MSRAELTAHRPMRNPLVDRSTIHPVANPHCAAAREVRRIDVTQTFALVDGIPPVARRPGRPRRRPESLLGDKGYDSNAHRDALRNRRILPVLSRKGSPNIKDIGRLRYIVEQTFALLHQFKRLAMRWERRTELHDAFVSLACSLICFRRLKQYQS